MQSSPLAKFLGFDPDKHPDARRLPPEPPRAVFLDPPPLPRKPPPPQPLPFTEDELRARAAAGADSVRIASCARKVMETLGLDEALAALERARAEVIEAARLQGYPGAGDWIGKPDLTKGEEE